MRVSKLQRDHDSGSQSEKGEKRCKNRYPIWSLYHWRWFFLSLALGMDRFAMWRIGVSGRSVTVEVPFNSRWLIFVGFILVVFATMLTGHAINLSARGYNTTKCRAR